jgi:flagellar hook-basal body complex protein FliE
MKILPQTGAGEMVAGPGPAPAGTPPDAGEFRRLLTEVISWQREADQAIRQSLLGEKDLHEVMLALERASLGVKVLVQVRNKVLQAYEELSRMSL